MDTANIYIHKQFLQASPKEVSQYCLEVIKVMRLFPKEKHCLNDRSEDDSTVGLSLRELLIKCLEMVFAAALCEIFYKWLSDDGKGSKNYWTIPSVYFNPNFEYGLLEEYLASAWGDRLYSLLGDVKRKIPWLPNLLSERKINSIVSVNLNETFDSYEHAKFVQQLTQVMIVRRRERMKEILEVDEMPNKRNNSGILLSVKNQNNSIRDLKLRYSNSFIKNDKKKIPHKCAYCYAVESEAAPFKMCQQCLDENWSEPSYYCCGSCQIEHWFKNHQKEHYTFVINKTNQDFSGDGKIETDVPPDLQEVKSYILNCTLAILFILSFRSVFACLFIISKLFLGY